MASASTLPVTEPPITVADPVSISADPLEGQLLTRGAAPPLKPIDAQPKDTQKLAAESSGGNWYVAEQAQGENQTVDIISQDPAHILPVYLASPTTAGALITMGSQLQAPVSAGLISFSDQQVDPPLDDDNVIVVTAPDRDSPIDPLADLNAEVFEIGQDFDRVLMKPVADVYQDVLPKPARSGLRNFLNNLGEPIVFLNYLLQLKPGKAFETLGRFAINSTIGIGGLIDVAKDEPFYLPHRRNGFANTLGFYGIDSGSYLYLPIVGATTVRDLVGDGLDLLLLPTAVGSPFNRVEYTAPAGVLRALDRRIELDDQITEIQEESNDPYVAQRDFYLNARQMEIDVLKGRIPDPLCRKSCPAPEEQSQYDRRFIYEMAELWYLRSEKTEQLAINITGD